MKSAINSLVLSIAVIGTFFVMSSNANASSFCASVVDANLAGIVNASPNDHIAKGWNIRLCAKGWPLAEAVRVGGDFGPSRIVVPRAADNSSLMLYAPFYAPIALGRHSARYQLEVGGTRFGPTFGLDVNTTLFTPYAPSSKWAQTQGDHPAWLFGDGYNGKARDFAPLFGACNAGVNLSASVLPVAPGTVIAVNTTGAYVAVAHDNGLIGLYLHLYPITVSVGQSVTVLTKLGSPSMHGGQATGCHVHVAFATYVGSAPRPGTFNPNNARWLRSFPPLASR